MPLTVTVAATGTNMVALSDLPSDIRGSNNANDPDLERIIRQVSAAIPRYLGYVLAQQTYQEDVPGYGDTLLEVMVTPDPAFGLPPGGPITSVTSVQLLDTENGSNPTAITDYLIADAMAGHLYRKIGWKWTAQLNQDIEAHPSPQTERPLYRVTYTSGWTMPQIGDEDATQEGSLPLDLRMAAVDAVVTAYRRQQRDLDVTLRRMGDVTIEYAEPSQDNPFGFPISTIGYLAPWRRLV